MLVNFFLAALVLIAVGLFIVIWQFLGYNMSLVIYYMLGATLIVVGVLHMITALKRNQ
jgi:uncharacterized membrane protein HdeD (DUF308 family)